MVIRINEIITKYEILKSLIKFSQQETITLGSCSQLIFEGNI